MIQRKLIISDREILGGIPVFTGTRVPAKTINFAIIVLGAPDNTFETLRPLMPKVMETLKTIKVREICSQRRLTRTE